ncbi:MAG: YeiH family protein [Candidatus Bathyarchaeia archaeon]
MAEVTSEKATNFLLGFILLFAIAIVSWRLDRWTYAVLGKGVYLTYILWAILIGMLIRNVFFYGGVPKRLETTLGTYEFWIKTGLVLLGAKLSWSFIWEAGIRALAFVFICMPVAIFLIMWMGREVLDLKSRVVMAVGISVCGVSAAIATAAAIGADRRKVAYIITILMLVGLPTLFLYPAIGYAFNMPAEIYGAWAGGSIDNTATAVAAGFIYGEVAGDVATVTKYAYNALIGVFAFVAAVYFARLEAIERKKRISVRVIWDRFPKFIIGFLLLATLNTLGLFTPAMIATSKHLYKWLFAITFAGVGLEAGIKELKAVGGKPVYIFIVATIVLTVLAYVVSYTVWA